MNSILITQFTLAIFIFQIEIFLVIKIYCLINLSNLPRSLFEMSLIDMSPLKMQTCEPHEFDFDILPIMTSEVWFILCAQQYENYDLFIYIWKYDLFKLKESGEQVKQKK